MKKVKDFTKLNHCGNIQMLGQLNPIVMEVVGFSVEGLIKHIECLCGSKLKDLDRSVIYMIILDMLQDIQYVLLEEGKMSK